MADDPLKEAQEAYRDLKSRYSNLSNDYDLSRREIKTWQDKAAEVDGLKEKAGLLKAELKEAVQQLEQMAKAAEQAGVNTSQIEKRADAFLAIREALTVK